MPVAEIKLPPDAIRAIERIVAAGHNAKVTSDKSGKYAVYEEKVKKVPLGHPQP